MPLYTPFFNTLDLRLVQPYRYSLQHDMFCQPRATWKLFGAQIRNLGCQTHARQQKWLLWVRGWPPRPSANQNRDHAVQLYSVQPYSCTDTVTIKSSLYYLELEFGWLTKISQTPDLLTYLLTFTTDSSIFKTKVNASVEF